MREGIIYLSLISLYASFAAVCAFIKSSISIVFDIDGIKFFDFVVFVAIAIKTALLYFSIVFSKASFADKYPFSELISNIFSLPLAIALALALALPFITVLLYSSNAFL